MAENLTIPSEVWDAVQKELDKQRENKQAERREFLEIYKKDAQELGVTLQEYLLYRVLEKLEDLEMNGINVI